MSLSFVILVAVIFAAGLAYAFVPEFHTGLTAAYKVSRDDLDKIKMDGSAIVKRLESHSAVKTEEVIAHTEAAAKSTALAATAKVNSRTAADAADAVKNALSSVVKAV